MQRTARILPNPVDENGGNYTRVGNAGILNRVAAGPYSMSERTLVDFIEEWQTGAFLGIGTILSGVILSIILFSFNVPFGRVIGFFGGAALAFLSFSYLLYGR